MPVSIAREEVQRLVTDEDALVIEVLPTAEYQDEHIDGAINMPLKTLDRQSTSGLDRARPLIVY